MEHIESIIVKYLSGTISDVENDILQRWIAENPSNKDLFEKICRDDTFTSRYHAYADVDKNRAKFRFKTYVYSRQFMAVVRQSWKYAAIIIPILLLSFYVFKERNESPASQFTLREVSPGEYQARLVLENGFEMSLDSTSKSIVFDDSVSVEMIAGTITYMPRAIKKRMEYNTIAVPRGGEYRLTLSDGTRVHLNSESTLRFPLAFSEDERKVYLTGEAYFEVVPNPSSQFVVEVAGMQVRQYGTVFNINAYNALPEVVLVSGSIGITSSAVMQEVKLQPGQKARCGENIDVSEVDVSPYIGWTKGRFDFDNCRLDEIAEILMRWYDVEIDFANEDVAKLKFTGSVSRKETIHHIMNAISYAQDVEVRVVDDKIVINK